MELKRGNIVVADLAWVDAGEKHYLIVSNNRRNRALGSALALRLTTSNKPDIPSIVEIPHSERGYVGKVLCDDVYEIWEDEPKRQSGSFSPEFMLSINEGIRNAFGITN